MYDKIKAYPTEYNGVNYRSRLEARWALFFDYLKIPVKYEPKQFVLESRRYTPDFALNPRTFIEVKPSSIPLLTLKKVSELSVQYGFDVYIFGGDFWEYDAIQIIRFDKKGRISFDYDFRYCPSCDTLKLDNVAKCRICNSELIEFSDVKQKVKHYRFKDAK